MGPQWLGAWPAGRCLTHRMCKLYGVVISCIRVSSHLPKICPQLMPEYPVQLLPGEQMGSPTSKHVFNAMVPVRNTTNNEIWHHTTSNHTASNHTTTHHTTSHHIALHSITWHHIRLHTYVHIIHIYIYIYTHAYTHASINASIHTCIQYAKTCIQNHVQRIPPYTNRFHNIHTSHAHIGHMHAGMRAYIHDLHT